ncbi:helix-turn-helix domain-containing protein [Duncaniella muris]|uniref:helix-turn-helix domain-containing protein n=1 Tax=Duncaniella muris TaxID=2094150 RepID=UPI0025A6534F|nr:hypothetical protein [Duncaniella muris]
MDLVSRLKHYLDSRQISITQFADECGIPRPTGSQLLAGRNKKVSDEIISKIHSAYPDLNIVWLMFGEGNMMTDGNIEISEPQISPVSASAHQQSPINQQIDFGLDFDETPLQNSSEKSVATTSAPAPNTTFTFATPADPAEPPARPSADFSSPATGADSADDSITLTTGKGKRVTGIVVYYDDCTYESFIPDPAHGHPFMR